MDIKTREIFFRYIQRNRHLKDYIEKYREKTKKLPEFMLHIPYKLRHATDVDIMYVIKEPCFAHIYMTKDGLRYNLIEPQLTPEEEKKKDRLMSVLFAKTKFGEMIKTKEEFTKRIEKLLKENVIVEEVKNERKKINFLKNTIKTRLTGEEYRKIEYLIKRDIIGVGKINALLDDIYLEDITGVGASNVSVYHRVFGMIETNVKFKDDAEIDNYLRHISERIGKPASLGTPIIDSSLPDGSRINIIYAEDVSLRGPSFSIRRRTEEPLTITQLVSWNTLSAEMIAYLWICLENKVSMLICGGTATGKTTLLNAMSVLIPFKLKIYSVEDTLEVTPPHEVWQRLMTRDTGPKEQRVESFHLLKASLRSRPDYVFVGEIRGKEGAIAFQSMQAGSPVLATFHAANVTQLIQRLTSPPIEVPLRYVDNLGVILFMDIVSVKGREVRRVTSGVEIVGYIRELNQIATKQVFEWLPRNDTHAFRGKYNSHVLEDIISPILGYRDRRRIYEDVELRTKVIKAMMREKIFRYNDVIETMRDWQKGGVKALAFPI